MRRISFAVGLILLTGMWIQSHASSRPLWGNLEPGSSAVGFRLIEEKDHSRSYPAERHEPGRLVRPGPRTVRIYLWYPARRGDGKPLPFGFFARMAAEDIGPPVNGKAPEMKSPPLPLQLVRSMPKEKLERLMTLKTASILNAKPGEGTYPAIVLGQGLYYESPLTHLVLCEYLASNGYVVMSCPLKGTQYRLVNLNVRDLETQIRDMEFALARGRQEPFVDPDLLGVIGYDMGGMAGVTLAMRNRAVDAFVSLDAGILFGHRSQLPNIHPSYDERMFPIPWLHITQDRFGPGSRRQSEDSSLMDRKPYGDSYLLLIDTANHGAFTSYAMYGIENPVTAYWRTVPGNPGLLYETACRYCLHFFNGYLRADPKALAFLAQDPEKSGSSGSVTAFERKKGKALPADPDQLIHLIIDQGTAKAIPAIERARKAAPEGVLIDESVLNWLGYHFLYWWGRPQEALDVFRLNVDLFPQSANAFDSLGEAYAVNENPTAAIEQYQKSLQLNPDNQNAKAWLERLSKNRNATE
ncbi:hypothetical protein ACFLU6_12855 [Acidobacteriota bacterium]